MSLFCGTGVLNNDNAEKHSKKKHGKRITIAENELEPVHGSVYSRRRASKTRRKIKTAPADPLDSNEEEEKLLSPKSKSRRHLRREVERLVEENHMLTAKLENSTANSGLYEELKEKDLIISKLRSKYNKLVNDHEFAQQECEELKSLLQQREVAYTQLHMHHEELTRTVQDLEKTKASLLTSNHKLNNDNVQLNEDVTLLKNVVYRLNVELQRYQDKLKECGQTVASSSIRNMLDDVEVTGENQRILESWGRVDTHALAPLLNAYQENLLEKQELIVQYEQEVEQFTGRCKDVIAENETLHKEIENTKSKCNEYAEEIKTLTEDAILIKEQNDLLTKQAALQKQKLQEIHSVYEQKVESMSQDNNKLHKEYLACKTELSNVQGKYEVLNEGYEKLKNNITRTMPVSVHTAAVEECKRLFEELKIQYETEKKKLTSRIKQLEESQPDTEKQLVTLTLERNQLKALTKRLEKNLKRTQRKLEYFQNTIYSMQISRDSFKRQLSKTTSYCEELVAEYEKVVAEREKLAALLQVKEKENADIQYLGDNIAHRMGNLKNQLKSVQKGAKEQLATVEKHIKIQELGVHEMKAEYHRELQRLKQLIKQKEDVIGRLQREKCRTQDNLEMIWKAATSDDKKVKDALKNTKIYNV